MRCSVLAILVSLSSLASTASTAINCTQALLLSATESYISAQLNGTPLTTPNTNISYIENDKPTSITTGIQSRALKIDHSRSYHDTVSCSTYTELVVASPANPYVIGTQLHLIDGYITNVTSLVTTTGDWLFNATSTLYYTSREAWSLIPLSNRDSRSVILAAANAYLDLFLDKNVTVPWGTPCNRLEGGMYIGKGLPSDSCNVGVPSGISLVNRRYVVDETVGSVDVFLNFGGVGGLPDSHEFRVEGGRIRFVHTITVQRK